MFTKLFIGESNPKLNQEESKEDIINLQLLDTKNSELELLSKKLYTLQINIKQEAKNKLKDKDKPSAKRLLYKNKKINEHINQIEEAKEIIEEKKPFIESSNITKEVLDVINYIDDVIKEGNKEYNTQSSDDCMEQIEEREECQKEIFDFFVEYEYENLDCIDEEIKQLEDEIEKGKI